MGWALNRHLTQTGVVTDKRENRASSRSPAALVPDAWLLIIEASLTRCLGQQVTRAPRAPLASSVTTVLPAF